MKFDLEILTPEKELYQGQAVYLSAKAIDGEIGIMANHAPLITVLEKGVLKFTLADGERREYQIGKGLLKAAYNRVAVLA